MNRQESWDEAVGHYRAGVKGALLAEYRCRSKGCLLMHVWQAPRGLEFFAPSSRVPDRGVTAGQWHWLGYNRPDKRHTGDRAGGLEDLADMHAGGWLWMLCEHVRQHEWVDDIRRDCAKGAPGDPAKVFLPRPDRGAQ
ncbi:hypothetical protein MKOR_01990 [Mycolicibacillus koreensis]|nr:hypothetical protein MKOR_01990 [Mycolicibacillus koreensis]